MHITGGNGHHIGQISGYHDLSVLRKRTGIVGTCPPTYHRAIGLERQTMRITGGNGHHIG